jgi:hypothetical protein
MSMGRSLIITDCSCRFAYYFNVCRLLQNTSCWNLIRSEIEDFKNLIVAEDAQGTELGPLFLSQVTMK